MVRRMASLHDYEDYARETLSRPVFDHLVAHRSDLEELQSRQDSIQDFQRIKLKIRGMLNLKYFEGVKT